MNQLEKPIKRSSLRRKLGKEYFVFKRKLNWYFSKTKWSSTFSESPLDFSVYSHKSMILRQLQGVDMQLQHNKRTNLSLAIEKLNGINIKPGETFSLWKLVGRPTKRKGYLDGLVLNQGSIGASTGGGLCQLGNLIFWMVGHSALTVTERYRHGYDVFPDVNRNVPFGAGATLSYNYIDLQITNNTSAYFRLELWLDETHLNGKLTSSLPQPEYFLEERVHTMNQQYWGGYSRHNQIFKVNKDTLEEELLVENHAIMMYEPFLPE